MLPDRLAIGLISIALASLSALSCRQGYDPSEEPISTDQPCEHAADCQQAPSAHPACVEPACDAGRCSYTIVAGQVCEPANCTDGVLLAERSCDREGGCPVPDPPAESCLGYACDQAGQTCLSLCRDDQDCVGGLACNAQNTCEAPRRNGAACRVAAECASGICADAVCCDLACEGNCDRCDLAGQLGRCMEDDDLCLGDCDRCDVATGDCVAERGACSGMCAACVQTSPVTFRCSADESACPGTCDACQLEAGAFECRATPQECLGDCGICRETDPQVHDCMPDHSTCEAYCVPSTCLEANDEFNCDYSSCATCNTAGAPSFAGACGSGLAVQLPTACEYTHYISDVRNEAAAWEWTTYACWSGVWELVEQSADGDLCSGCSDGTWDTWEDSCGNTSSLRVDCLASSAPLPLKKP